MDPAYEMGAVGSRGDDVPDLRSGDMEFDPLCDRYIRLTDHASQFGALSGEIYLIRALIGEIRRLRSMLEPVR